MVDIVSRKAIFVWGCFLLCFAQSKPVAAPDRLIVGNAVDRGSKGQLILHQESANQQIISL